MVRLDLLCFQLFKLGKEMARKKYMAIHTFHSDEMKKAFFRGLHKSELTDFEWRDGYICLLYTSPSPRDAHESRMPSSA